jgi:putative transcriptional regulator
MNAVLYKQRVAKVYWKLRAVMADRKITNKALAKELGMNPVSISKLKSNDLLPEIGGEALANLCQAITTLSSRECTPEDLMEYVLE